MSNFDYIHMFLDVVHNVHSKITPLSNTDVTFLDFDDDINFGSEELLAKIPSLNLKAHLFGHIHAQHGVKTINGTIFSNGAVMNSNYDNLNKLQLIII